MKHSALIATVWPILRRVSCRSQTDANAPKRDETHENMSLGSRGVDQEHSLRNIPTRLCDTNFWINCNSLAHFAPSFVQ